MKRLFEVARKNDSADLDDNEREVSLGTSDRIMAILTSIIDEDILGHVPLSYDMAHICGSMKVENPQKHKLISAFYSLDYKLC